MFYAVNLKKSVDSTEIQSHFQVLMALTNVIIPELEEIEGFPTKRA